MMPPLPSGLSYDIAPLLNLEIAVFSLPFKARTRVPPQELVPAFRSLLGYFLKKRFCPFPDYGQRPCETCDLPPDCHYTCLFSPTCASIDKSLTGKGLCHTDPPRPYTLDIPLPCSRKAIHSGETACLHLTLIGDQAIQYRRPMLESIFKAALTGELSRTITPLSWQALIPEEKGSCWQITVREGEAVLSESPGRTLADWVDLLPAPPLARDDAGAVFLEIAFRTPVQLSRTDKNFTLTLLLKSIISRLRDLKRIYHADNTMGQFPQSFYSDAKRIKAFSSLSAEKASWFSKHRNKHISLGGIRGSILFKGNPEFYLPVLAAGFFIGIGSKTVYGLGRFEIREWTDFINSSTGLDPDLNKWE